MESCLSQEMLRCLQWKVINDTKKGYMCALHTVVHALALGRAL